METMGPLITPLKVSHTNAVYLQRCFNELRMIGLVPRGNTLYYVAFVDRGDVRRTISLRLAERREVKKYVENVR